MPATDIRTALAEQHRARAKASWWSILKRTGSEWVNDDAMTWAAAVSCYAVLALAPLLVIAVKVATVLLGGATATQQVQAQVTTWMGPASANAITEILHHTQSASRGILALIISLVLVVFSATGVFVELQVAMNRIWEVKRKPGPAVSAFLRARLASLIVLLSAVILLCGSVLVTTWLGGLAGRLGGAWSFLAWVIDVVGSIVVLTLVFAVLYRTLPDATIPWNSTWIGAFVTAILFEIGKFGLAAYFRYAAPTSAYGAVGSLAAVLIWIYYSTMILLAGAEFTEAYTVAGGQRIEPSKHAEPLDPCEDETDQTARDARHPPAARKTAPQQYGAVLAPHVRPYASAAPAQLAQRQMMVRNTIAAGAGLAVGALIGGYGAMQARHSKQPRAKDLAAARLNQRIRRVEQKVGRVSQIKHYLQQQNVNERIDAIRRQICQAHRVPRRGQRWTDRIINAVKAYL